MVASGARPCSLAAHCALMLVFGQRSSAVPTCTALAPSVNAAATPRPSAIPPGSHDRYLEVVGEPRQEREEPDVGALGGVLVERAAMAAGLHALSDDRVRAGLLGGKRLLQRGGTGEPGDVLLV